MWGARTRGQLAEAVADLPEETPAARRAATRGRRVPSRVVRRTAAAALVALVAYGRVVVVGVTFGGGETVRTEDSTAPPSSVYEVRPSERRLDLSRFGEEVTVVVPDGTRVDLRAVRDREAVECGPACEPQDGPVLRLSGRYVDELEVLTRTEAGPP